MALLAAGLITAISVIALGNSIEHRPPRATWIPSFVLIGTITAMIALILAVGRMLH